MITLKQIAALHIDRLSGGSQSKDSQIKYRSTIMKIRAIANSILRIEALRNRDEGDRTAIGFCVASYDLTVTKSNGSAEVTLPEFYMQLPYNAGIKRVFPKGKGQGNYDYVLDSNPGISSNTRAGQYSAYKFYWPEGLKLKFRKVYDEPDEDLQVTVQILVAAPDSIGESDPLPITSDMVEEILKRLWIMDNPQMPSDKLNNNNPNV